MAGSRKMARGCGLVGSQTNDRRVKGSFVIFSLFLSFFANFCLSVWLTFVAFARWYVGRTSQSLLVSMKKVLKLNGKVSKIAR